MSKDILKEHLKTNQDFHYNNDEGSEYAVSTGSLIADIAMNGGIRPGILRLSGVTEGGKTSETLSFMNSFLSEKKKKRLGLYIKAEGRLSPDMQYRSGVRFVEKQEDWESGTCFIFKCNVYEPAIDLIRKMVSANRKLPKNERYEYFFVLDSMDSLIPKGDYEKAFEEAGKVAGGALISSDFLRRMSLAFSSLGHVCVMISQVRSKVSINPYEKGDPKVTNASGGNAQLHYSDWILEMQQRWKSDIIFDDKNKPIGHFAKFIFRKSPNEKTGQEVRYPIKYNQPPGKSIWVAYEIVDLLIMFDMVKKGGAWFTFTPETLAEAKAAKFELPEKVQGMDSLREIFEENEALTNLFADKFKKTLTKG